MSSKTKSENVSFDLKRFISKSFWKSFPQMDELLKCV